MARVAGSFIEKHVEKVVLGLCAVVMAGVCTFAFTRFKTADGADAEKLCAEASEAAAAALARVKARTPAVAPDLKVTSTLDRVFGRGPDAGLIAQGSIQPALAPLAPYPPTLVDMTSGSDEAPHDLGRLLPPETPVARGGRSPFTIPPLKPLEQIESAKPGEQTPETRGWVAVAAQLDLLEQGRALRAAGYGVGKFSAPLVVLNVHLQRRAAGDEEGAWEDVNAWRPFEPVELPKVRFDEDGRLVSSDLADDVLNLRRKLIRFRDYVARITPPPVASGDTADPPPIPWLLDGDPTVEEQEGEAPKNAPGQMNLPGSRGNTPRKEPTPDRRFKKWMRVAEDALRGGNDRTADLNLAAIMLEACLGEEGVSPANRDKARKMWEDLGRRRATAGLAALRDKPRRPEKMMPLAAVDLEAEPGKSYVYRLRYEVLNPLVGNPSELKNADDARQLVLASAWSPPTLPVEVRSNVLYFVTAINDAARTAEVVLYRIEKGLRFEDRQTVAVGDSIGRASKTIRGRKVSFTTGLMVLDVLPEARQGGGSGGGLVVVNTSDGRLYQRTVTGDRADPKYVSLSRRGNGRG
ncbi:MAG: hypothetical protein U1A27_09160 [Phycisphaerae bacterium]